uniref:EGF-like domain-containing protein n=1 Tax=Spongospora subterranea TaxID=70186 RepID=A0A0H5RCR1_9EUKA|eukprot:CRZ11382.1 hypothetical protein [Spongospora subterranea]
MRRCFRSAQLGVNRPQYSLIVIITGMPIHSIASIRSSIALVFVFLHPLHAWVELESRARCLFPNSTTNCSSVLSPRALHTTASNGSHILLFGGRKNVLFNTSVRTNIGDVAPVMNYSISLTVNPGSNLCSHLSNCWMRGLCASNRTCVCSDGFFGNDCSFEEDVIILDDFWIYDIKAQFWSEIPKPNGSIWPGARVRPAMSIYGQRLIMFGGYSQLCADYCNDVWEFRMTAGFSPDGNGGLVFRPQGWTQLVDGPGKRWRTTAKQYNNLMIIYGGHRIHESLSEVWEFNFDDYTWHERRTSAADNATGVPLPRLGHSASIYSNFLYIYGGVYANINQTSQEPSLSDFWKLDLRNNRWTQIHGPRAPYSPHSRTGIQSAVIGKHLYLFGGFYDEFFFQDTWQFDLVASKWALLETPGRSKIPQQRMSYSLTAVPGSNTLVLVGGIGRDSSIQNALGAELVFNDVWAIELDNCGGSKYSGLPECSGNGVCLFGTCRCQENWFDDDCSMKICTGDVCHFENRLPVCKHCNDRGACVAGKCQCFDGYRGIKCDSPFCINNNCSNSARGICFDNFPEAPTCTCTTEFYGDGCEFVSCPGKCSGHGLCEPLGTCICDPKVYSGFKYIGHDCSNFAFFKDDSISYAVQQNSQVSWAVYILLVYCLVQYRFF